MYSCQSPCKVDNVVNECFIREVQHSILLENMVPVKKKTWQVQICIQFQHLSKACRKDDFLIPHIEMLLDTITVCKILFFMDRYSRYCRSKCTHKTRKRWHSGHQRGCFLLLGYEVWPKEHGDTYQWAINRLQGNAKRNDKMLPGRSSSQVALKRGPFETLWNYIWLIAIASTKDEPLEICFQN